ncbi:MAG: bifunctional phosphoglucose/phosphomannose isomerase [archaeon]
MAQGTIDSEHMGEFLRNMHSLVDVATHLEIPLELDQPPKNIIIAGVGGSALPGNIISTIYDLPLPFLTVSDYDLPALAGKDSLIFIISHSGNTEETIALFRQASKLTKNIVTISSGGKLQEMAKIGDVAHLKVPGDMQPRMSYLTLTIPIIRFLSKLGLVEDPGPDLKEVAKALAREEYEEMGKDFAKKLEGRTPLIYASRKLACVAKKWKINFNENAKTHAFFNLFPEFNHNEINGFIQPKGPFAALILRDDDEHIRVKKRMRIVKEMIKEQDTPVYEVMVRGVSPLVKVFSAIYIGDWISYYLALENGVNPSGVPFIEDLKKRLSTV